MTVSEAIEALERGKCVKLVNESKRYFRMYRNDTILELLPDVPVAARVMMQFTREEFESEGFRMQFEVHEEFQSGT